MNGNYQFSQNLLNSLIQYSDVSQIINYLLYLTQNNSIFNNALFQDLFYDTRPSNTITTTQDSLNTNIPLILNYNPYLSVNYGSMETTFNNGNTNVSTFPFQSPSIQSNEFSFLNLKRNHDPNEIENFRERNTHYYCTKSESHQNEVNGDCLNIEMPTSNICDNADIAEIGKLLPEQKKNIIKTEKESFSPNEQKREAEDTKQNTETKICGKNKKMCKGLLKDSLLEHIDEIKPRSLAPSFANGQLSIVIDNSLSNNTLNSNKQKSCYKKNKNKEQSNNKKIIKKNTSLKKLSVNYQATTVIFHDKDYKNTKNVDDFMKYNFNFHVSKNKTKKMKSYYKAQHVDLKKLNKNFPSIYSENIEIIKPKWLRSKFYGNDVQLKQSINLIKEIYKVHKSKFDEETCLHLLDKYGYNIEELIKSKCI